GLATRNREGADARGPIVTAPRRAGIALPPGVGAGAGRRRGALHLAAARTPRGRRHAGPTVCGSWPREEGADERRTAVGRRRTAPPPRPATRGVRPAPSGGTFPAPRRPSSCATPDARPSPPRRGGPPASARSAGPRTRRRPPHALPRPGVSPK